jgi:hypothetical protein
MRSRLGKDTEVCGGRGLSIPEEILGRFDHHSARARRGGGALLCFFLGVKTDQSSSSLLSPESELNVRRYLGFHRGRPAVFEGASCLLSMAGVSDDKEHSVEQ